MNFGYKKLYINGSLQDSEEGSKQDVICPATGEKIAQIAEAGKSDAIKALNSARDGYKLWSKLTLNDPLLLNILDIKPKKNYQQIKK